MPEPLSPSFRVQMGKLSPRAGKCPAQVPMPEGAGGRAGGKGSSQLQLP